MVGADLVWKKDTSGWLADKSAEHSGIILQPLSNEIALIPDWMVESDDEPAELIPNRIVESDDKPTE